MSATVNIGPGSYNLNENSFIRNPFKTYTTDKSVILKF